MVTLSIGDQMSKSLLYTLLIVALWMPTGHCLAQEASISKVREFDEFVLKAVEKARNDEKKIQSQAQLEQLRQLIDTLFTVKISSGQSRIHFGNSTTLHVNINNALPVTIHAETDKMRFLPPQETGLGGPHGCVPVGLTGAVTIAANTSVMLSWNCPVEDGYLASLWKALFFSPGDQYQIHFSADVKISGKDPNVPLVVHTISRPLPLAMDLRSSIIMLVAGFGAFVGTVCHLGVRQAFIRHVGENELNMYEPGRSARRDGRYMLLIGAASIVLTACLAPLTNWTATSPKFFSMRIIDTNGALVLGLTMHFIIYDLGYNKLLPFLRKYLH